MRPGPWNPLPATPGLAPGTARRTTSIDVARPDGEPGRVRIELRGQDLVADGTVRVVDRCELVLGVTDGVITSADLDGLVGADVRAGFGRRLASVLPEDLAARSLRGSMLDDLGGAALVSGYSGLREGRIRIDAAVAPAMAEAQGDVCSGWVAGGPLHRALVEDGQVPVPYGPAAPAIEAADPDGWHPMPALEPGTVRRRRQLDVAPAGRGHRVWSHFRDSYFGPLAGTTDDGEMVMHEYSVEAELDGEGRLATVDVVARVLPWHECPGAVPSAGALVGVPVTGLPARVRAELVGPATCTHLNSTLRSLADVAALLG